MEVKYTKSFKNIPGYSIEWGYATWTEGEAEEDKDWSIRNRYEKADGGYNHVGSKEIPWTDFNRMILESINENQFSKNEIKIIFKKSFIKLIRNIFKR